MSEPDVLGHVEPVAEDGKTTTTHPEQDVQGCEFDAYVERDWQGPTVPRPSHWTFIRRVHEDGFVDWLGQRQDPTPWPP